MTFRLATGSASSGGALEPASTSTSLVRSTHITHVRRWGVGKRRREPERGNSIKPATTIQSRLALKRTNQLHIRGAEDTFFSSGAHRCLRPLGPHLVSFSHRSGRNVATRWTGSGTEERPGSPTLLWQRFLGNDPPQNDRRLSCCVGRGFRMDRH